MVTDKIKKYVILNIPYVFAFWFCLKLGMAYRIAEGADFGPKFIHTIQTIGPAFGTIAPGLNGFDWFVGITGAAIIWLPQRHGLYVYGAGKAKTGSLRRPAV